MLAVVLATLVKFVAILKSRIEEHIKKDNKSHIFKHYTPPQHALTHIILFVLK